MRKDLSRTRYKKTIMQTMDSENTETQKLESYNEQIEKAYVAGFVDSNSSLGAYISKDTDYSLGYNVECRIKLTRTMPFGLQLIQDYCDDRGIQSYIKIVENQDKKDRYELIIKKHKQIQMFLKDIYPFMRDKREQVELMVQAIIPAINKGYHLDKNEFMKLVAMIEDLREMNPYVSSSQYTTEYFEEEWNYAR